MERITHKPDSFSDIIESYIEEYPDNFPHGKIIPKDDIISDSEDSDDIINSKNKDSIICTDESEKNKPWIDKLRPTPYTCIPLDGDSPAIESKVKGLNMIELAGHQARNAHAMIELEKRQYVVAKLVDKLVVVRTKAGRIAEKFGSGKTFTILALILKSPCPKISPEIFYCSPFNGLLISRKGNAEETLSPGVMRYNKKYLDTTIIFVSPNVLNYWSNTILTYTDLTCTVIDTILKLRQFEADIIKGTYKKDITLIKNGTSITRGILGKSAQKGKIEDKQTVEKNISKIKETLEFNKYDVPEIYPLITSVAMIMQKHGFIAKRLILDDFDTMKVANSVNLPSALFLWYVSSTNRVPKHVTQRTTESTLKRHLKFYRTLASDIIMNDLLNYTFRISCKPEYTDSCCAVGMPSHFIYTLENPYSKVNDVLAKLDIPNGKEIMEAFNSGSVEDGVKMASKFAGIDSKDPIDLLDKLLGDKRKIYLKCQSDIAYCNKILAKLHDYPKIKEYPSDELKKLHKDIQSIKIRYSGKQIEYTLKKRIEASNENMKIIKPIIERAKENLGGKNCQVCGDEFGNVDMVMMKCCNLVLCSTCGFHSSGIPKSRSLSGTCAKCRKQITIKDIIFISTDFNINNFIDEDKLRKMKEVRKDIKETEIKTIKKSEEKPKTKEDIIVKIVEGKTKKLERKEVHIAVNGLLVGAEQLPKPEHDNRKIVIFSNHPDILNKIKEKLTSKKIQYIVLEGTANQRYEQVQEHKKNTKIPVIILNSMQACSGIDMPYLTDMIFCHDFIDKQVMGQACGRAQRMGRKYSMNYHYVLYDNELRNFTYTKVEPANPANPVNQNNPAQAIQPEQVNRILTLAEIRRLPVNERLEARRLRLRQLRELRQRRHQEAFQRQAEIMVGDREEDEED